MPMIDAKVLIGVPCSLGDVPKEFTLSLFNLERPCPCQLYFQNGYELSTMRNNIVEYALSGDYTHVLFLDLDMIYPTNTIKALLEADKNIVCSFYVRRSPPNIPLFLLATETRYVMRPEWPPGMGVYEVGAVSPGGLLVRTEVFRKIRPPWFSYNKKAPNGNIVSEDIYFSVRARDAGFKLWCRTDLILGHISKVALIPVLREGRWSCESMQLV